MCSCLTAIEAILVTHARDQLPWLVSNLQVFEFESVAAPRTLPKSSTDG